MVCLADVVYQCHKEWVRNFRLDQSIEDHDTDSIIAFVNVKKIISSFSLSVDNSAKPGLASEPRKFRLADDVLSP